MVLCRGGWRERGGAKVIKVKDAIEIVYMRSSKRLRGLEVGARVEIDECLFVAK